MNAIRCGLLGLSLVLLFGLTDGTAHAQKAKKKGPAAGQLVPPAILDKLELTAEQKKKADQLQEEFAAQVKQVRAGMLAEMKQAKANKDKAAMKRLAASAKLAVDQVRQRLEPRFEQILTPAQKKKYAELKNDAGKRGARDRFGPAAAETVNGTLQRLDTDKGTLVLNVDGQTKTYVVSRATKVLDAAGAELPNGLSDKALAPGAKVSVKIQKMGAKLTKTSVLELRLAGK